MMDANSNKFVPVEMGDTKKRDELLETLHAKLRDVVAEGKLTQQEADVLKKLGPPIFKEGEVIIIRGYPFRVARIDPNKLILRPIRIGQK